MTRKTAATVLIIGIVALTAILIWVIAGGTMNIGGVAAWGPADTEVYRKEVPISEIDNLETDLRSEDVTITKSTGSNIEVVEYGPSSGVEDRYIVSADTSGRTLVVSRSGGTQMNVVWGTFPNMRVEIKVPGELKGHLAARSSSGDVDVRDIAAQEITSQTTSGSIGMQDLKAKTISADASSGDVDMRGISASDVSSSSTSGSAEIKEATAENLRIKTTSGDVWIDGVKIGSLSSSSTSGGVTVKGGTSADTVLISNSSGDADCRFETVGEVQRTCTSGNTDIVVADAKDLKSIYAESTSGDVTIQLPAGTEVTTNFSTTSGDTYMRGEGKGGIVVSGDGIPVSASTTSGNVTLGTS